MFISPAQAESIKPARVYGRVIDATNGLPLSNTNVIFWNGRGIFIAETNASGFYAMNVTGKESYQVYAYHNPSSTLGFDYIPAHKEVYVEGEAYNVSFMLSPGASINAKGDLRFFKTLQPPKAVSFTIVQKSGLRTNTTSYGEESLIGQLLNLRGRLLFVPCNVPIKVEVDIHYSGEAKYHFSIDNKGDYLNLNQGDLLKVDLGQQVLSVDIHWCYNYTASTQALISEAERLGFYLSYERNELLRARNLLDAAASALSEEAYDEAYADLREAYFILKRVREGLPSLYLNASASTLFITPFLGFTAIAAAALISERGRRRLVIGLGLYGLLFLILYLLYPGYIILGMPPTLAIVATSFLIVYFVVHGLPYAFREKTSREGLSRISAIIMAFSLSTKNLRRRRLRTFLALTLTLTSVFAFTALTSISLEQGFAIWHLGKTASIEGFLLRKTSMSGKTPFDSIQLETYRWLQERPEITLIAPKIENMPQENSLGLLSASALRSTFLIDGIVGVMPSLEAKVTKMDNIIVQGRFLKDNDLNGILISKEVAKDLGAGINDTLQLFNQDFTLIGIFDGGRFDKLKDLDGAPLAPYRVIEAATGEEPELEVCPGFVTVIMYWKTAQELPSMMLSRINVQVRSAEAIMPIARQAVLKWMGVEALAFMAGQAYRLFIGSYYLASGFIPAMIPLAIVVLNIGILMRDVIYERKQELVVMSSAGLNPFHITALFLAEALTIGIVAGSLGYILGITSYRFLTLLPFSPPVKHKVEAIWGILALCSSITAAALGSALPALKTSTIVTPSLERKWKIEEKPKGYDEPWVIRMPIRVRRENLDEFFTFIGDHIRWFKGLGWFEAIKDIRVIREGEFKPLAIGLSFAYIDYEYGVNTENELISTKSLVPHWYMIKLTSIARRGSMHQRELYVWITASFIRRLILLYTLEHKA